jgi:hypothetical protein
MERFGFVGATKIESKPERVPVPDRLAVCGLPGALSEMDKVPVRVPSAVGVKVTEIAQLAPAPNVLGDNGQVEVCAKSPEVETPQIVSGTVWVFFRVTLFPVLVVLITWLAKVRLTGDRLTGTVPVPIKLAVCGEFGALSLTVSVPVRVPRAVGVKVTEIAQLSFAASVFGDNGQFDVWAKSPEVAIPAMARGTV